MHLIPASSLASLFLKGQKEWEVFKIALQRITGKDKEISIDNAVKLILYVVICLLNILVLVIYPDLCFTEA